MEALPRRVMLIYNERKKAVSLPPASSAERSDALLLEETARTLFLNGDPDRQILMQEFDDFFDDWVEIEKEAEVKDRQKIKIVSDSFALIIVLLFCMCILNPHWNLIDQKSCFRRSFCICSA